MLRSASRWEKYLSRRPPESEALDTRDVVQSRRRAEPQEAPTVDLDEVKRLHEELRLKWPKIVDELHYEGSVDQLRNKYYSALRKQERQIKNSQKPKSRPGRRRPRRRRKESLSTQDSPTSCRTNSPLDFSAPQYPAPAPPQPAAQPSRESQMVSPFETAPTPTPTPAPPAARRPKLDVEAINNEPLVAVEESKGGLPLYPVSERPTCPRAADPACREKVDDLILNMAIPTVLDPRLPDDDPNPDELRASFHFPTGTGTGIV